MGHYKILELTQEHVTFVYSLSGSALRRDK